MLNDIFLKYVWEKSGRKKKNMRIKPADVFAGYPSSDIQYCKIPPEKVQEINNYIAHLVENGLTATYKEKEQIYTTINISANKLSELFPSKIFQDEYEEIIRNTFKGTSFETNLNIVSVISKFPFEENGEQIPLDKYEDTLKRFLNACEMINHLQEDTFIRNISEKCGLGSKLLEKAQPLMLTIFFPEEVKEIRSMPQALRKKQESILLERLHIIKNYPYACIKGEGKIFFQNGSILILDGYKNNAIQIANVKTINKIECRKILTIENQTTFNDFPYTFEGLIVYVGGYMNTPTEQFLAKTESPIFHSGDLDAFGFDILYSMRRRLQKDITPYKMDIETYEQYKDMAIDMTDANRAKFESFLKEEKNPLFELLLKENKTLEQESFSSKISCP